MREVHKVDGEVRGSVQLADGGIRLDGFVEVDPRTVDLAREWARANGPEALPKWASTALILGAQVAALSKESADVAGLAGAVSQLADRAEAATRDLAADVSQASAMAAETLSKVARGAADETARVVTRARQQAAEDLAAAARATGDSVSAELRRLLGTDDSPTARAISDLVARRVQEGDARLERALTEVVDQARAAWDGNNPASAVAALERRITGGIDRLRDSVAAVAASAQAQAAAAAVAASTPAKGRPFEELVGTAAEGVASALGGSYTATGDSTGAIASCRKGDGVIEIPGVGGRDGVRLVLEMTTAGAPRKWGPYLEEAARNRGAAAALGLVPTAELVPGGAALAVAGPGRMVMAYDAEAGGAALLHAACTLLVLHAQRDAARDATGGDLDQVGSRLSYCEQQLVSLAATLKTASSVRSGAARVVAGLEACHESLARALGQARATLEAMAVTGQTSAGTASADAA